MYSVVTGRFNNETLERNYAYRQKYGFNCMYCTPLELSPKISYNTPVFVIEMNNSTNKIEGIGFIKNKPVINKYHKVHTDPNNNRYIYTGKYFINRELIEQYNSLLVYILDIILFKGKTHSKRGFGLTLIPEKVIKTEICQNINIKKEIIHIFHVHFRQISRNNEKK
jgi:hypothetical protein